MQFRFADGKIATEIKIATPLNIAASQTDTALVAAVAGKKLRVISMNMKAGGTATNITFNSKGAGAGTAISPLYALGANGDLVLPPDITRGWFESAEGAGVSVTSGTGATTGIQCTYAEV